MINSQKTCDEIDAMQHEYARRVNRLDIDEIDRYDMGETDDMESEPYPWSKSFGVACLIAAGLIVLWMWGNA